MTLPQSSRSAEQCYTGGMNGIYNVFASIYVCIACIWMCMGGSACDVPTLYVNNKCLRMYASSVIPIPSDFSSVTEYNMYA